MKKLFVSCMIAFMAICSVGAQEVYIGGGFTVGSEDSEFVFQISPEVGCHLTDQWAVGGEIGYTHYDDYNRFQFAPYARYTFYKTGIVGLFVDGTIGIAAGDGDTGFRLGLRPGLSLKATEHISFVTKVGFLGYSDSYNGTSDFGGVNFDTEKSASVSIIIFDRRHPEEREGIGKGRKTAFPVPFLLGVSHKIRLISSRLPTV